jgi:hypothetical protein
MLCEVSTIQNPGAAKALFFLIFRSEGVSRTKKYGSLSSYATKSHVGRLVATTLKRTLFLSLDSSRRSVDSIIKSRN